MESGEGEGEDGARLVHRWLVWRGCRIPVREANGEIMELSAVLAGAEAELVGPPRRRLKAGAG